MTDRLEMQLLKVARLTSPFSLCRWISKLLLLDSNNLGLLSLITYNYYLTVE